MTAPSNICLVIGTPCFGGVVTSNYTASLLALQRACRERDIDLRVLMLGGDALITRSRQNIVAHFLNDPVATHLLFIDADIGFAPEQVFRLLDFNAPLTAAIYPVKKIAWDKINMLAKDGFQVSEALANTYVMDFADPHKIATHNGFMQMRFVGTGFMLLQREMLLAMMAQYPELHYQREHQKEDILGNSPWRSALFNCLIDERGYYLSEDYSFCKRWTDMGGQIWADVNSELTHTGPVTFTGNVASQFGQAN